MKKIISLVLAAVMALSLVACGGNKPAETTAPATTTPATTTPATTVPETTVPETTEAEVTAPATAEANGATTVLQNIWNNVSEKWPVAGGSDMENPVWDGPGNCDTASESLAYQLLVPADQIANLAEAGNMIHMMNANTFTCAAYKLVEGADQAAFVAAMETAIKNNPWMCGFPDQLVIAEVDGYVVVVFGGNDAINPFVTAMTTAYPAATTLVTVNPLVG